MGKVKPIRAFSIREDTNNQPQGTKSVLVSFLSSWIIILFNDASSLSMRDQNWDDNQWKVVSPYVGGETLANCKTRMHENSICPLTTVIHVWSLVSLICIVIWVEVYRVANVGRVGLGGKKYLDKTMQQYDKDQRIVAILALQHFLLRPISIQYYYRRFITSVSLSKGRYKRGTFLDEMNASFSSLRSIPITFLDRWKEPSATCDQLDAAWPRHPSHSDKVHVYVHNVNIHTYIMNHVDIFGLG